MNFVKLNPNISYASIASGKFNRKEVSRFSFKQLFSFPYFIMKYILKNPKSSEGLLKLYKACKLFFLKQQILIVFGEFMLFKNASLIYSRGLPENDISKLQKAQIWFNNDLFICDRNFSKFNFSQIYRSTIKSLCLCSINLDLNIFKLLIAENFVEKFILYNSNIKDDANDEKLSIDAVLKLLPNLKSLFYGNFNEKYSSETLKNLKMLKFNYKFKQLCFLMLDVSETFDPKLFCQFIQQNVSPSEVCQINLRCMGENSAEIKQNLKVAEKEVFPEENRSELFKIEYCHPKNFN